ncbi:universal stress protein [Halobellus clavatus]|jgi:nucleotide-binding universal stress UspA family protein|uniref:Nucleotide-binding universal stress protein, UspA family n=1 Tax=Halobellus clavatus TaxID=660517 RepID=A0A1H3GJZ7_9EURY|nr:universal stress protein [Halobellus clavatus]SDY02978.1 Nucleotide-binding universal stress protein, UspA family [Halobellus clavatus]
MPRHVLVPIDGSPQSMHALRFAAGEWGDASVTLLHVINPVQAGYSAGVLPTDSEDWYQEAKAEAEATLDDGRDLFSAERAGDGSVETAVEVGRPAATIVEQADERDADHVVVGSHGRRGVSRLLLGSVAEHVARRSPVPVTIVR